MGVLDGSGDRRREGTVLDNEVGASHCNQWGLVRNQFKHPVNNSACYTVHS